MAIDTSTLKTELENIFKAKDNTAASVADAMSKALEKWIKTATVQVTAASSTIKVTGSATAQMNPNPISISGSPSSNTGGIT